MSVLHESEGSGLSFSDFSAAVRLQDNALARNVAAEVENFGTDRRFFAGFFDGSPASLLAYRLGESIARLTLNVVGSDNTLVISDYVVVLPEATFANVTTTAQPKTDEELLLEQLDYDIWRFEHPDADTEQLMPGTPWKSDPITGPIASYDLDARHVLQTRHSVYENTLVGYVRDKRSKSPAVTRGLRGVLVMSMAMDEVVGPVVREHIEGE